MIEQLRDIPWLELDIDIDLEKLSKEYQILLDNYTFEDYKTIFWQVRRKYKKAWSGISLISSDGSLYSDLYEGNTNGHNFQKTKLKDLVPYMYEVIEKISNDSSGLIWDAIAVTTHGWAAPLGSSDETDTPPSQHPDRTRVFLVCIITNKRDIHSVIKLDGKEAVYDNSGTGALATALLDIYPKVKLNNENNNHFYV